MAALRQRDTRIITCQPFNVQLLVQLVRKYAINVFQAAPYQLTLLIQYPDIDPTIFEGILMFYALGSVVSENLRKQFREMFPKHPLIIGYGMSEACISISATGPTDSIEGLTVGRISPNIQIKVKVIGKGDSPVETGISGEILAKPEFPFLV
jgi:acyl-CoA synthetase (AMP-forming)/AMP-acid ligase II